MSQSYKVKANNNLEFDINIDDVSKLDAIEISPTKFHILQDNISYKAEIITSSFDNKEYKVKVNNNTYNINIFSDLDYLIKVMGFEIGATKKVNEIKAPMPGLILDINVKVGQQVLEDEALLILEAMKMENVITSPRDGVIKSISVSKGDAVDKNKLLIAFE
jgi:biotin carboxyl carrier protein